MLSRMSLYRPNNWVAPGIIPAARQGPEGRPPHMSHEPERCRRDTLQWRADDFHPRRRFLGEPRDKTIRTPNECQVPRVIAHLDVTPATIAAKGF